MNTFLYAFTILPSLLTFTSRRNSYVKHYWFIDHCGHCRITYQQ